MILRNDTKKWYWEMIQRNDTEKWYWILKRGRCAHEVGVGGLSLANEKANKG